MTYLTRWFRVLCHLMVHLMLSVITEPFFLFLTCSPLCETEGEQEELVWAKSLRGGCCGRPIQEDGKMHQHVQSQMETAHHCVSVLIWYNKGH